MYCILPDFRSTEKKVVLSTEYVCKHFFYIAIRKKIAGKRESMFSCDRAHGVRSWSKVDIFICANLNYTKLLHEIKKPFGAELAIEEMPLQQTDKNDGLVTNKEVPVN